MSIDIEIPLDAHLRVVRVGDIVQQTLVIDHANKLYTFTLRGKVVEVKGRGIVVMMRKAHDYSLQPWDPKDWVIVGHEALS